MYIELPRRSLSRLALVLLLASNGPAWCQAATKESPWSNTGLDLSYFRGKVTTPGCHRSETRFLACISAIQAILDHHGDGLRLRHSTWSDTKPSSDRPYKQFGELRIVRVPVYRGTDIVEHLKEARQHRGRVQAWRTVYQNIGDARVDFTAVRDWVVSDLVEGDRIEEYAAVAINGYIGAEDAHARLVPAADLYEGPKASKESYTGIGVALQEIGGAVMIGEVIRGGPAFEAGLRPYDLILTLDDSPVQRQALEEVTASLRGSQGSAVELKVSRRNREFRVNVIREQVQVKTVTASVLTDRGNRWGYLRIEDFMARDTCRDVQVELASLLAQRVAGIVLDLRNNMGGLIDQSVCVADMFLGPGRTVLKMQPVGKRGRGQIFRARGRGLTSLPLVTLVNANTGSAAEVLAGALQDHQRSFLIGERTFGKGTVQTAKPWNQTGSLLQLFTTARFWLPSGRTIQIVGIEPDLTALERPDLTQEERLVLREEDLFPTALPAAGKTWSQPRPNQVSELARCTKEEGVAEQRSAETTDAFHDGDYPLYYAQDALTCVSSRGPVHPQALKLRVVKLTRDDLRLAPRFIVARLPMAGMMLR